MADETAEQNAVVRFDGLTFAGGIIAVPADCIAFLVTYPDDPAQNGIYTPDDSGALARVQFVDDVKPDHVV